MSENYRPISLTSVPCKLLEHIICRHMLTFLEEHRILTDLNHGFRASYSCESQLLITSHDLLSSFDKRIQTDIAILDFSKAFDTVPHNKLLYKLDQYGIRGALHEWVRNFLTKRTMSVVLEGESSRVVTVDSGVPQGTVMGPLLFLCHINDLPTRVKSQVRLFADDCLLYREIHSQQDHIVLQDDLKNLEKWASDWGMRFNAKKCYVMSTRNKSQRYYHLNDTVLKQVENNAYLGLQLSESLKWNTHINKSIKKANATVGFLRRNLRMCTESSKRTAYISLVRPTLEYGAIIWDPYQQTITNEIERVQRRAARFITGDNKSRHPGSITKMLGSLELAPLAERRRDQRLVYFHKIVSERIPSIKPNHYLTPKPPKRSIRTTKYADYKAENIVERYSANNTKAYTVPIVNTDQFKHSFFNRTVIDWNHLDEDTVSARTTEEFKNLLGRHH